jgi:hypothetical protein
MSAKQRKRARAVLFVDHATVEWFDATEPDAPRYCRVATGGERPADLAEAATRAVTGSGGVARPCVVALSDALARQRLVHVPELPRRALTDAFLRKAARMLDLAPEDTFFAAALVDESGLSSDAPNGVQRTWLLTAVEREWAVALRRELARRRFRVEAVRAARQAGACRAVTSGSHGDADAECATLAVTVGVRAATVALVSGERLVAQYSLDGDYLRTPSLGARLLQDVRNGASFWRRLSRGVDIGRVLVLGLDGERARTLAASIASTLSSTLVAPVEWEPRFGEAPDAGRMELLVACLEDGPFHTDLCTALPTGRGALLARAAAAAALILAASGWIVGGTSERSAALDRETASLDGRSRELAVLEHAVAEARAHIGELELRLQRSEEALRDGLPLETLVAEAEASLGGRAQLLSVAARRDGAGGHRVEIGGRIDPEPVAMVETLRGAAGHLERALGLDGVEIVPPATVPETSSRAALPFSLAGEWTPPGSHADAPTRASETRTP